MVDYNKANRQVCDVDIREYSTKKPFLWLDTANTTTTGLSGENVYAMAKGTRKITFADPLEGTLTIEAQVYPYKLFSLFSDGTIESKATYAVKEVVKATEAGKINISAKDGGTIDSGYVFVYAKGSFGDEAIVGTYADGVFSATAADDIVADAEYEVGYIVTKDSGVKKITFNNKKTPKDYYITMSTVEKDERGNFVPLMMTAYKATPQRSWELALSSEGDPASISCVFEFLEDSDGNVFDMIEIEDDQTDGQ